MNDKNDGRLLRLTARVVGSYVGAQPLPQNDLVGLVASVHESLASLGQERQPSLVPAVPVSESVKPDHLVCLEDGLRFRTLKRHLSVAYGMTPEEYRAKWNLPANYPMVAPNYSRLRSRVARDIGLGGSKK
ncbi:MAG: MucR family transcriptional regulator [Rhizobiaceae bacterium]